MLALGDEQIDKIVAWRDSYAVTFPMLLMQDTYDAHVDPEGDVYSLDIVTGKKGNVRSSSHGVEDIDVVALFEQLLAEP